MLSEDNVINSRSNYISEKATQSANIPLSLPAVTRYNINNCSSIVGKLHAIANETLCMVSMYMKIHTKC